MAGIFILAAAIEGNKCAWIAPTYRNSRPLWRFVEMAVNPKTTYINKVEHEVQFSTRGQISIYSADNDVSIRGEAFDLVIIDEAAQVREETYTDVVLPTIADRNGRILLISTPKGKNWFFVEYQKAIDCGAAWHAPSNANPNPNIQRAFELARTRVSERTFRQEWLAEFVEGGVLFRNVRDLAILQPQEPQDHTYIIGVDWARTNDYTVFTVLDVETRSVVWIDRFTGVDYPTQGMRLEALYRRYNHARIIAEYNAMGGPMVEFLQQRNLPVEQFNTTADTKVQIIDALVRAFEFRELYLLKDATLINELEAYAELKRTLQGKPVYGAPEGLHDDCVMSLALAWSGMNTGHWWIS